MNPPSPSAPRPSAVRQFESLGMFLFFMVVLGSQYLAHALQEPVMQWFALHGGSPADEPLWYSITRDFAEGICSAGALLLCVLVAVVAWRRWPSYALMMVCMPLVFHGGNIGRSLIIYQACPGLLDGQRITTRWLTTRSYTFDHDIAWARALGTVSGFLLALVLALVSYLVRRRLGQRYARREMEGSAK